MTVKELREVLAAADDNADMVVYVDVHGKGERPFGLLDEELYLCKYFDIQSAAYYKEDNAVILEFDGDHPKRSW